MAVSITLGAAAVLWIKYLFRWDIPDFTMVTPAYLVLLMTPAYACYPLLRFVYCLLGVTSGLLLTLEASELSEEFRARVLCCLEPGFHLHQKLYQDFCGATAVGLAPFRLSPPERVGGLYAHQALIAYHLSLSRCTAEIGKEKNPYTNE